MAIDFGIVKNEKEIAECTFEMMNGGIVARVLYSVLNDNAEIQIKEKRRNGMYSIPHGTIHDAISNHLKASKVYQDFINKYSK